jgi:hypothetical protein
MANFIEGYELRKLSLGSKVTGQTQDITTNGVKTYSLFAVTGGQVLITALWGLVTTTINTSSETLNLQMHPTAGDTTVLVTATALGSGTAAGDVIGVSASTLTPATAYKPFGQPARFMATTGQIESVVVTSSSNGVVAWYCTYVPLTDGAVVAASVVAPA